MKDAGVIGGWRDELFPVSAGYGQEGKGARVRIYLRTYVCKLDTDGRRVLLCTGAVC